MRTKKGTFKKSVILHLSDTHRTNSEKVSNEQILISLRDDFERYEEEGLPKPNVVVVSGDIVQSATKEEYDEAKQLYREVLKHWKLSKGKLLTVPGNHDVSWETYRSIVRPVDKEKCDIDELLIRTEGPMVLAPQTESEYISRLEGFNEFTRGILTKTFPIDRKKSFLVTSFPNLPIPLVVVGFNSVDNNDEYNRKGRINPSAICEVQSKLKKMKGVKIAVWHHDIHWNLTSTEDYLQLESLHQIIQAGFDFGLCGHSHRPAFVSS